MTSVGHETKPEPAVLVLTVGTGDMDRLEETLFRPLTLSLKDGDWKQAVLLPSSVTEEYARKLERRLQDLPIRVVPLTEVGAENDADACFAHFDGVLDELREAGHPAEGIVADFTRGTKAMSAALVLAATRHGIPELRYIHGERDGRGTVRAGREKVDKLSTDRVTMRLRLDDAGKLMKEGAYAAVLQLLPDVDGSPFAADPIREEFREEISRLRKLAAFWSAWDRLDYRSAATLAGELAAADRAALDDEIRVVRRLAGQPEQDDHEAMANWLRVVVRDLLANGRRRIKHNQYEDALLRGYRVLELIGQFRLFDRGHDSGRLCPQDTNVREFAERLSRNSHGLSVRKTDGREVLTAAKEQAARFLNHLEDPFGKKLLSFDKADTSVSAKDRNNSILIHGFSVAKLDAQSLCALYGRLDGLLEEDRAEHQEAAHHDCHGFGRVP